MNSDSQYSHIHDWIPSHWMEETIQANGIAQHLWRTGGKKPPLLMLHGYSSLGLYWLPAALALEDDFDLIMPDMRGHGQSGLSEAGYSIGLVTQDTAALIQALHLERLAVVGHSNGGLVAAQLAADHPERVRRVTLVDPPMPKEMKLDPSSPGFQAWRDSWVAWMESLKGLPYPEQVRSYLAHQPAGMPVPSGMKLALAVEAAASLNLDLIRDPHPVFPSLDLSIVKRVTCPMMLITGNPARGGQMNPSVVQSMTELPGVEYVHFEDTGHFVPDDQPEAFYKLVREFNQRR